ncbi:hypothetical protein [Methanosarcina acetivorans]|uniref:Uncharacterized protein n=1 Tax=Methanosarcina acetivorans (strain ATCC 35395 / DSM 2834 / JCM 12185 / C2A) TaxID=188937 RepID=Q8TQE6_METAC|nr:hypothetical protein [Methanosarcina acetivorans]AAM05011.1 predicted protein [Methanosarcina acetivorans C2A]
MTLTLDIKGDFTPQEVSEVIRAALDQNERVAKYKIKKYSGICENFENKYGMDSDHFMEKFDSGDLGDDDDFLESTTAGCLKTKVNSTIVSNFSTTRLIHV